MISSVDLSQYKCFEDKGDCAMKKIIQTVAQVLLLNIAMSGLFAQAMASSNPQTEPLLQQSNLAYSGSFRLPDAGNAYPLYSYAGRGLAYDSANNGLIISGALGANTTGEVSIPSPAVATNLGSLPISASIQGLADSLDGKIGAINPNAPSTAHIGGYLVTGNRLIISAYSNYDAMGTQVSSHFARSLDLSSTDPVLGPVRVGLQYPGFVSGYMTNVPPEWQTLLGGPALTGNCCLSITGYQSNGPAASSFDPAKIVTASAISATPLVGYPHSSPLGPGWGTQNDLFNGSTNITGIVFPFGTRSVLFFGVQGTGPFCYGPGTPSVSLAGQIVAGTNGEPWCYDPVNSSKGPHAYPYVYQVWAYDANDLLAVKNGSKAADQIQPYAIWHLMLPYVTATSPTSILGVAYDPNTNRIFIAQGRIDNSYSPIIDVFTITDSATYPKSPTDVSVH